jgi:hypothetical protein
MLLGMRMDSSELLEEYREMISSASFTAWRFIHMPTWANMLSLCPPMKSHIEHKLFEHLFMNHHNLPPTFDFAKYIYYLFQVVY